MELYILGSASMKNGETECVGVARPSCTTVSTPHHLIYAKLTKGIEMP